MIKNGDLVVFISKRLADCCPRKDVPLRVTHWFTDNLMKYTLVDVLDEETGEEFREWNVTHFKPWTLPEK